MAQTPNFTDFQFVNASLLNTAAGYTNASRQDVLANGFTPGLYSPSGISFGVSALVLTVTFANSGTSLPRVLFGTGILSGGYGTIAGSISSVYAVNTATYVPVSGSQTVYVVATYSQIGQNAVTISGPPPGHPDYNPAFVPVTAYTELLDSVSVTATLSAPDNITSIELCRFTLAAGQVAIGTVITSNQILAGASVSQNLYLPGSPTTTTQPPADSSTKVATTAFVQAAGYLSTVSSKSAAYTISVTDNGALIEAGAYPITLPSAPATAFRVTILSSATGTTILPNGNTVNLAAGATSSTIPLPAAGDFVTLAWDGSVWRVVSGSAAMLNAAPLAGSTTQQFNVAAATSSANAVNLGQFPNSIGSSGYQKLPNGLILQWGYIASTNGTFNFPIAFPNAGLSFFACNSNSQGAFVDNAYGYIVSNTQFFIATKTSYPDSNTISNYPCTWLAIGN